jgi:hypothetical protein
MEYVVDNIRVMRENVFRVILFSRGISVASFRCFAHELKMSRVDALFPQTGGSAYVTHQGCKTGK